MDKLLPKISRYLTNRFNDVHDPSFLSLRIELHVIAPEEVEQPINIYRDIFSFVKSRCRERLRSGDLIPHDIENISLQAEEYLENAVTALNDFFREIGE